MLAFAMVVRPLPANHTNRDIVYVAHSPLAIVQLLNRQSHVPWQSQAR
jgi:hypothetical protein